MVTFTFIITFTISGRKIKALLAFCSFCWCVAADRMFVVQRHRYVDVGIVLAGRSSVTFQVKAVKDAHIALTPERGVYATNNMYELVLGSSRNTYTVIRQVHNTCVEAVLQNCYRKSICPFVRPSHE